MSREPLSLREAVTATVVGAVVLSAVTKLIYGDVRESVIVLFGLLALATYITARRG